MPRIQQSITADALNDLEALCHWLNGQPDTASYFPRGNPYLCTEQYQELRRGVIFWSAGYGWRLHMACARCWRLSGLHWSRNQIAGELGGRKADALERIRAV